MAVGTAGIFAGRLGDGQGNGGAVLGGEGIEGDWAGIQCHIFTGQTADRGIYQIFSLDGQTALAAGPANPAFPRASRWRLFHTGGRPTR